MNLLPILDGLVNNAFLLPWLLALELYFLALTYGVRGIERLFAQIGTRERLEQVRRFILTLIAATVFVICYWAVDVYIVNIPDPVFPIAIFVLLLAVAFGPRTAFVTSVPALLLNDYYLFEPRYVLFAHGHLLDVFWEVTGVVVGVYAGMRIKEQQERLARINTELSELVGLRDQFISIAAHDLKNPITVIKLYTELLRRRLANRGDIESVGLIESETDKLLDIINSVLDFSRIQGRKFTIIRRDIDLKEIVERRLLAMRTLYGDKRFAFTTSLSRAPYSGDGVALDRMITNLLSNAVKYSPFDKPIEITLDPADGGYVFAVRDRGSGIPEEALGNLFKPFFQVPGNAKPGLGLGLYIVQTIVLLHGGSVAVDTGPGAGTTMTVRLPAPQQKGAAERHRGEPGRASPYPA